MSVLLCVLPPPSAPTERALLGHHARTADCKDGSLISIFLLLAVQKVLLLSWMLVLNRFTVDGGLPLSVPTPPRRPPVESWLDLGEFWLGQDRCRSFGSSGGGGLKPKARALPQQPRVLERGCSGSCCCCCCWIFLSFRSCKFIFTRKSGLTKNQKHKMPKNLIGNNVIATSVARHNYPLHVQRGVSTNIKTF